MSILDQYIYHDALSQDSKPLSNDLMNIYNHSHSQSSFDHSVPETEAQSYYFGLRGRGKPGPRLIYRTSTDIYNTQSYPRRLVQLLTVHKHAKLTQNNLWDRVRDETAVILDCNQVKFTSIDLVRFRWNELSKTVTTAITIWIGVFPKSTTASTAFNTSEAILQLLKSYDIDDIDIAFRDLVPFSMRHSAIPIHSRVLSIIAGLKTGDIQGGIGFYFKECEDFYGVTARHVLFPTTKNNDVYRYDESALTKQKKKYVALMGTRAFKDLVASVEGEIREQTIHSAELKRKIDKQDDAETRIKYQKEVGDKDSQIIELQKISKMLRKDLSDIKNRVIGHVVWSPPISGLNTHGAPQGYMRDVCVIKLNKHKFWPNLMGNVINIGQQFSDAEFVQNLYRQSCFKRPSDFIWPFDSLYPLKRILSAAEITEPNVLDRGDVPERLVSKQGSSTGTTMGRVNGFLSRARRYSSSGIFDSIEVAVVSCENPHNDNSYGNKRPSFSQVGDSGASIVGSHNDFVAQLTAGTGSDGLCDITYGTPMEWLWKNVIKPVPRRHPLL